MLRNFLTIALRHLWKNKGLTAINIFGLSVGLAVFSLLLLHVTDEFSFDRFHSKADHLYRVVRWSEANAGEPAEGDPYLPMPLGPALREDFPDVVNQVRFCDHFEYFVRAPRLLDKEEVNYADASVFEMFDFPLRYGDAKTALQDVNSVVLTEAFAQKLFGEENPTGRTLELKIGENFEPFTVTGVAVDLPPNSSIRFNILLPFARWEATPSGKRSVGNWNRSSFPTYVQLREGSGLAADSARLDQFYAKYYPKEEAEMREKGFWTGPGQPTTYHLQPLRDMHTDTQVWGGNTFNPRYAWILLGIGGMVLFIACINFTTLAIGRSAGRAREVGMRKVIGAARSGLVGQFLAESLLLTGISLVLGIGLLYLLLPWFNELTEKKLALDLARYPEMATALVGLLAGVGVLAGAYPAFVLSGFRPLEVLRSKFRVSGSNFFTKSLVTVQFVLSIGLIACTVLMLRQLNFLRTKSPGFDKEMVVMVNAEGISRPEQGFERFKRALSDRPDVVGVSGAEIGLGAEAGWSRSGWDVNGQHKSAYEYFVDPEYIPLLGLELAAGRNFDARLASDTVTSIIVNEAFCRDFGWTPEQALGQALEGYSESFKPLVIGVVKDFNYRSLHDEIQPQLFHMYADYAPVQYFVRLRPGSLPESLATLKTAWAAVTPELPFQYKFLDENLAAFYKTEEKWSRVVGFAGGICILLACLGLFGLGALAALNRTKEIGIRKVLGASVVGVAGLLTRDFLKLVLIAVGIATPLAWWAMQKWLQDFAYRIDLHWWMFALAGLAGVAVALLTVGVQSVRAALSDPVKSLRSE